MHLKGNKNPEGSTYEWDEKSVEEVYRFVFEIKVDV